MLLVFYTRRGYPESLISSLARSSNRSSSGVELSVDHAHTHTHRNWMNKYKQSHTKELHLYIDICRVEKEAKAVREERAAKPPPQRRPRNRAPPRRVCSFPLAACTASSRIPSTRVTAWVPRRPCTRPPYWNTSRPKYSNWPAMPARISRSSASPRATYSWLFVVMKNWMPSSRQQSPVVESSLTFTRVW